MIFGLFDQISTILGSKKPLCVVFGGKIMYFGHQKTPKKHQKSTVFGPVWDPPSCGPALSFGFPDLLYRVFIYTIYYI